MSLLQRILIVDDTPANIAIIGLALSDLYEIIVATNGNDALRLAGGGAVARSDSARYPHAGYGRL